MDYFWKSIGAALVTAILALALERQNKDFALILTAVVSGMLAISAAHFWEPVIAFLISLEELGNLNTTAIYTLIKILGLGLTGEISAAVCSDAGNSAIGKGLRFLTNAAIIYVSIPIYSLFLEIIRDILKTV